MEFLAWIEQLSFSTWVRESGSLWSYPLILFLHTAGMAFVVGINIALDLRLVGYTPKLPVYPMQKFFPILWSGFALNAITGVMLLMADATTKAISWMFYIKMTFIALALWNTVLKKKRLFGDPEIDTKPLPPGSARLGYLSIFLWMGAITAGRLMAYFGPVSGLN